MTPIAIVPQAAVRIHPVEIAPTENDRRYSRWNLRTRRFNKGRGQ